MPAYQTRFCMQLLDLFNAGSLREGIVAHYNVDDIFKFYFNQFSSIPVGAPKMWTSRKTQFPDSAAQLSTAAQGTFLRLFKKKKKTDRSTRYHTEQAYLGKRSVRHWQLPTLRDQHKPVYGPKLKHRLTDIPSLNCTGSPQDELNEMEIVVDARSPMTVI